MLHASEARERALIKHVEVEILSNLEMRMIHYALTEDQILILDANGYCISREIDPDTMKPTGVYTIRW